MQALHLSSVSSPSALLLYILSTLDLSHVNSLLALDEGGHEVREVLENVAVSWSQSYRFL